MAKQIQGNDIIKDNALDNHIAQTKELIGLYKELDNLLLKTAKATKETSQGANTKRADGIRQLNEELRKSVEISKAKDQIDDQIAKNEAKLVALEGKRAKELARVKLEIQRKNKANKEEAILTSKTSTEYEKASVRLNQMRRRLKDLTLTEGKASKSTQQLAAKVRALDSRLKKADARAGQFQRSVGNYGKAVSRVGGIIKGFGATMLATFGIRQVFSFFKNSIDNFRIQEKAIKKVEQAINSTGGAAGRTSEELQKMASSLQENSLFGDEDILNNVTAQLLTFTNIAGDQFDRTQQVALDLATVLDGDLKSASIQLGKALNDPKANLSALSRSGIQFSKEQKELINSLVETNRLADAQNVILTELERQYGGQAKAASEADGGIQQLKNTFGDLQEIIGGELLKVIGPIAKDFKKFIEDLDQEDVEAFARAVGSVIQAFADWGKELFQLIASFGKAGDSAGGFAESMVRLTKLGNPFSNFLKPLNFITEKLGIADDLTKAWGDALDLLNLREFAVDLGLASEETAKLSEEQKKNNTVRSKSIEIGNEILKQNEDELGDIPILIDALQDENTTREDKQAIIEKLNEDYPEVIGNIDLETASTEQLIQVKKDLVKQLLEQAIAQKKAEVQAEILGQILEKELQKIGKNASGVASLNEDIEELTQGLLLVDEVEGQLRENLSETIDNLNLESPIGKTSDKITELKRKIQELEAELKTVNKETESERFLDLTERLDDARSELARYNGDYKALIDDGLDREKQANDEAVEDLKGTLKEKKDLLDQAELEEKLRFEELKQRQKDQEDQEKENQKILADNEKKRLEEIDRINKQQEKDDQARLDQQKRREEEEKAARSKQLENLKKFRDESLSIVREITDGIIADIDKRIEARKEEISDSKDEIKSLQDIAKSSSGQASIDAAKSIKAEQVRLAKEKLEIEELEKKKRNLLIIVTGLEKASQNIGSGDANPFKNASSQLQNFLSSLPQLSTGTVSTIGSMFGRTGTTDGHVVRVDDREHVIGIKDSEALHKAGFTKTKDIVSAAMMTQNGFVSNKAMRSTHKPDNAVVDRLEKLEKALMSKEPVQITQQHIDIRSGKETLIHPDGSKTNNYHKPKPIVI